MRVHTPMLHSSIDDFWRCGRSFNSFHNKYLIMLQRNTKLQLVFVRQKYATKSKNLKSLVNNKPKLSISWNPIFIVWSIRKKKRRRNNFNNFFFFLLLQNIQISRNHYERAIEYHTPTPKKHLKIYTQTNEWKKDIENKGKNWEKEKINET